TSFGGIGECGTFRRDGLAAKNNDAESHEGEPSYFVPVHVHLLGSGPCFISSLGLTPNCVSIQCNRIKEVFDFSGAVHERIQMNANAIEQREVNIGQRCSLLIANMPTAFQPGSGAASHQDRKIVMIVKAGITHTATVQVDRVIEQRAITIGSGFHSLEEV